MDTVRSAPGYPGSSYPGGKIDSYPGTSGLPTADTTTSSKRTVDCHKQQLLRLDDMHQLVQILKSLGDHLIFGELPTGVVAVSTVVYDAVHVEVEVVNQGNLSSCYRLVYKRVPLAEPTIKLRDACVDIKCVGM